MSNTACIRTCCKVASRIWFCISQCGRASQSYCEWIYSWRWCTAYEGRNRRHNWQGSYSDAYLKLSGSVGISSGCGTQWSDTHALWSTQGSYAAYPMCRHWKAASSPDLDWQRSYPNKEDAVIAVAGVITVLATVAVEPDRLIAFLHRKLAKWAPSALLVGWLVSRFMVKEVTLSMFGRVFWGWSALIVFSAPSCKAGQYKAKSALITNHFSIGQEVTK